MGARDGGSKGDDPLGPPPRAQRHTGARGRAERAIEDGFAASSRVVVAAALIMFAVFVAFVPEGEGPIKEIGLGLAVGVFVDAFVVRMTLVPAVLSLLGEKAWWLPRWLDRLLPTFDIEGEGLLHQVALAQWPTPDDPHLVYAEGLTAGPNRDLAVALLPGQLLVVDGVAGTGKTALLLSLAGRMRLLTGRAKITGLVLPEQAGKVRRRTGYLDCAQTEDLRRELRSLRSAQVILVDHADVLTSHDDRAALASLVDDLTVAAAEQAVVIAVRDRSVLADLLPAHHSYLPLARVDDLVELPHA